MILISDIHNPDIPALTNQIAEDIPDIKENLEFHKDVLENFCTTWSNNDATVIFPNTIAVVAKTAAYTATNADTYIAVDASGGAVTITLPTATAQAGQIYTVKKIDSSANAVTIDGDGAETIDGAATHVIGAQWGTAHIVSNGTNWHVLSDNSANFLATGRKLWLYENTAPTGWTIEAVTDGVLAVKGGAQAYNANGGTEAGTWTQPNHTHTGPSHTHTGPSHNHQWYNSLAAAAHDQSYNSGGSAANLVGNVSKDANYWYIYASTIVTSYGMPDQYTANSGTGATGAEGTGASGGGATANTWRPAAKVGIIVAKD